MLHLGRVVDRCVYLSKCGTVFLRVCLHVTFRLSSGTGVSTCHNLAHYFDRCVYMLHLDRVVEQVCLPVMIWHSILTGVSKCHI